MEDSSINELTKWDAWIQNKDPWMQEILKNVTHTIELNENIQQDEEPKFKEVVTMATDGGKKYDSGTYEAMIAYGKQILAIINGKTPDAPETHSSYRSESYGLLSGISLIIGMIQSKIMEIRGTIQLEIHCDNKALVDNVNRHMKHQLTLKEYYKGNADVELQLLQQIQVLQTINVNMKLWHIKGHQDKHNKVANLSFPAQMNVTADRWANKAEQFKAPLHYKFPANSIQIAINKQVITSDHSRIWREATLSQDLRQDNI